MPNGTVLVVGSNARAIELRNGGRAAIGQYLNETVVPVITLIDAGYVIAFATPDGTKPHIDKASDAPEHFGGDEAAHARARRFYADHASMTAVRSLASVIDGGLDRYDGLFVPGGHAPAVDLMQDARMGTVLRHFHDARKPTALLCHAPVATVAALPAAGAFRAALIAASSDEAADLAKGWIYAGYEMTVFSSTEEKFAEDNLLGGGLAFRMPDALTLAGAVVTATSHDFAPNVVVDRELITEQNPRSDHLIAATLVEALERFRRAT